MATKIKIVNFGRNRAGAGSVGYRLINTGGSVTTARTQVGVSEIGSGIFFANVTFPAGWSQGIILWDDNRTPRLYATEQYDINASEVGSAVWASNPNNFEAADTFGQRMKIILQRSTSGGAGYVSSKSIFSEKEKQKLFKWLDTIFERLKSVEAMSIKVSSRADAKFENTIEKLKKTFEELREINKQIVFTSVKESKEIKTGMRKDINLAIDYLSRIVRMNNTVQNINLELTRQKTLLNNLGDSHILTRDLVRKTDRIGEIRTLLTEALNASSQINTKTSEIIKIAMEQTQNGQLRDKAILKILPPDKLKELIAETIT